MAMQMLKARLYEMELRRREEAVKAEHEAKSDIGWGHQIRSYVLQPYQMIKDLRTGVETSNTQAVLDGDLDDFMVAALATKPATRAPQAASERREAPTQPARASAAAAPSHSRRVGATLSLRPLRSAMRRVGRRTVSTTRYR
jgi:hypothetical protein